MKADQAATLSNVRHQLRNSAQYIWVGWDDAATWCVDNKINLEEALQWSDRSIQAEERFENLMTRVDALIIAGGMAYTFFKVVGMEIGASLFDAESAGLVV